MPVSAPATHSAAVRTCGQAAPGAGNEPRSVLLIVTRRIGDVLLATPLIRSCRRAWPHARIEALVFRGTEGVLEANPDLDRILTIDPRPKRSAHLAFALRLWRRYDLALSLLPSDRPTLYAWLAGVRRFGLLDTAPSQRWKRRLLHGSAAFDNEGTHTVLMHLALARLLGIEPVGEIVLGWGTTTRQRIDTLTDTSPDPIVVLHPCPQFNYKMWPKNNWVALGEWLRARRFRIFLTGGPRREERSYVADIATALDSPCLAGMLSLSETACLIARARLYVGPDTAVTHMAAALGVPTIALFGPSDPVKWGPWPAGYREQRNPWQRRGSQRRLNVTLLQGPGECVPCRLEGCERHIGSFSDCLRALSVDTVTEAVARALTEPAE